MTSAAALVDELRRRGVELRAEGDRLRYRPVSAVTPEDVEALRRHKSELLAILAPPPPDPAEVARRVITFSAQLAEWVASGRQSAPVFAVPGVLAAAGGCFSCGFTLEPGRSWRCETCIAAVEHTLRGG